MSADLKTVLIFAHECAPYHRIQSTVAAQRPAQFAKYLPEFGWRAIVVCCDAEHRGTVWPSLSAISNDASNAMRIANISESVIVPTPSLPWDGPLDRLWHFTLKRSHKGRWNQLIRKPLTTAKLLTGDYSQAWQPCARAAAVAIAGATRIDACIGEHSPDAGLFLARWFSRSFGVPWIADFRDAILQPMRPLLRVMYAPIARRLLSSASFVVNVTPYWSELDARLFRRPIATIPNGYDPEEFEAPVDTAMEAPFTVAYTGNIWPEMRLSIFMRGLAFLRGRMAVSEFREIRFAYRGAHHEEVKRWAQEAGVDDVVDSVGHIPRHESLTLLRQADVLLLLSIPAARNRDMYLAKGIYPGKTFEYFGAGRPIICVPGDHGLLDELLRRTRTGVTLETPERISQYLADAYRRWKTGQTSEYSARSSEVGRYSRQVLSGQLAQLLDEVTGLSLVRARKSDESLLRRAGQVGGKSPVAY